MTRPPVDVARLRGLRETATPGLWRVFHGEHGRERRYLDIVAAEDVLVAEMPTRRDLPDAELICEAVNALPALLDAEEVRQKVVAIHPITADEFGHQCFFCKAHEDSFEIEIVHKPDCFWVLAALTGAEE